MVAKTAAPGGGGHLGFVHSQWIKEGTFRDHAKGTSSNNASQNEVLLVDLDDVGFAFGFTAIDVDYSAIVVQI